MGKNPVILMRQKCCRRSTSSCSSEAFGVAAGMLEDIRWFWSLSNY